MTSKSADQIQINYKIVAIGQSGVGKTNILLRYVNNKFFVAQNATIGIQFTSKIIKYDDKEIKIQLWDTAGQQRYRALASVFYKNCVGALVIFDISNKQSFKNCKKWIQEIKQQSYSEVDLLLVGNKCDLENRQVTTQEAMILSAQNQMKYIQTSAAEGINIQKAFDMLIRQIYQKQLMQNKPENQKNLRLRNKEKHLIQQFNEKKKNRVCCN